MNAAALIVAGGMGLRAGGDLPKQRQALLGRQVYSWSIDAFLKDDRFSDIVLVVPVGQSSKYAGDGLPNQVKVVEGGASRTASVQNGLSALSGSPDRLVFIHDAARPGLDQTTIDRLFEALAKPGIDAASPALKIADALKRQDSVSLNNVSRDDLYRVQTPQVFSFATISAALADSGRSFVDDLEAVEAMGARVALVDGSENLSKITFPEDFQRMEKLLAPQTTAPRMGSGFDVHAFGPGEHVTLCGIDIPHSHGLAGHSDADVAWHALTDAILGAAALGDIGDHFPPSDPQWKGAPSALFLKHAIKLVEDAGWAVSSCDITIICEAPKVKPSREAMRQSTSDTMGLALDAVSVKATTTEGLGFTGRSEGIAAQAVAVLVPKP